MKSKFVRGPARTDTNLARFQQKIEAKYSESFGTYWDLHRWSLEHTIEFWTEIWEFLEIIHSKPFTSVTEHEKTFEDIPKWFLGAKLNYAENILRHPDEDVALILTGEERADELVTFGQLKDEVSALSSAFQNVGVKQGDVIASYISNRKEPIVAVLAAATIGALFAAVNPQTGVKATTSRLHQLSPKILLSIDRYLYNGEQKSVLLVLPDIVKGLPSLEHVVIVSSKISSVKQDMSSVPKSVLYHDFIQKGLGDDGLVSTPCYEQLSFNHPLTVNFTSGTTGLPKAVVHSAGAALLGPLMQNVLSLDLRKTDVVHSVLTTGWVSWNFAVTGMAVGARLLVYEGNLFHKYGTSYCDLYNRHNVKLILFPSSTLEDLQKLNLVPGSENQLSSLRSIASGSASVKGHLYDFVHEKIKRDVFFSTAYGSTELMMLVAGLNHSLPVYEEEIQVPYLGIDIRCYDEAGKSVVDQKGELVIAKPFPTMPMYLWKDEDMRKYKRLFFTKYPGVWHQGDVCAINSCTGGMIVYGRSDETINQRGARFGSSEIYSIVNQMADISDSLCAAWTNKEGDEIGVLFVQMKGVHSLTPERLQKLRKSIADEMGEEYVPEVIFEVKEIPRNVNGKKLEILVKKIIAGDENVSLETLANPECIAEYIKLSQRLQDTM